MTTKPASARAMPRAVKPMMTPAHNAMGNGCSMTTRQLVNTAPSTPTGRSSSIGIATTLEAKTGAASNAPRASQPSNR